VGVSSFTFPWKAIWATVSLFLFQDHCSLYGTGKQSAEHCKKWLSGSSALTFIHILSLALFLFT